MSNLNNRLNHRKFIFYQVIIVEYDYAQGTKQKFKKKSFDWYNKVITSNGEDLSWFLNLGNQLRDLIEWIK